MQSFEITDTTIEKLSEITNIKITDDDSLDFAIYEIMKMWNTQKGNIADLQKILEDHGIKPY